MKIRKITYTFVTLLGASAFVSCNDFLDRAAEDNYNVNNFYQNDEQCYQGVNYLYNSPWYDFQRGFIKVGEVLSGNLFWGSSPYLNLTVNGTDVDLVNMSYSLWAVIGHSNTVYNNLKNAKASQEAINAAMGECLTWKAMAYFYLVRTFGEVPIIHDNAEEIANGTYNQKYKVEKADVFEYIVMTLEKAIELLPEKPVSPGRIDRFCAKGLLAKVYLTKACLGQGSKNSEDLAKAASYAKDVIDNSGRTLMPVYSDIFRLKNNISDESLIAWRWSADGEMWTMQNTLQSDLAMVGFDEFGDCWGGWNGPSVDLQDAFGVSALDDPSRRNDIDTRRKATMMMAGDVYDYFWQDKGGFDVLRFIYDDTYGVGGPGGEWQCGTGAYNVKHLYGDTYDHVEGCGVTPKNMYSQLATHILRLADVYLIYAEAVLGNNASTSESSALAAFNAVRNRAIPSASPKASITFDDIWKERRLEFAGEGDRWYDFVRLSWYDPQAAINEIVNQRRNSYNGYNDLAKNYYESGTWAVDPETTKYDTDTQAPNVTVESFQLPFPTEDVVFNPHLLEDPIHIDIRAEYSY
ncbi:MAG: RagB/SusD family nutrient uptake outer membrane protein [Muribaculaceae bacterium]|nr:RagB/SusD family nutrient uptake outer membrane protein [Muribaculaceae bacterium]